MFIRQFLRKQTWLPFVCKRGLIPSPSFASVGWDIWYTILNLVSGIRRSPNRRLPQLFKLEKLKMEWHGLTTDIVSTCRALPFYQKLLVMITFFQNMARTIHFFSQTLTDFCSSVYLHIVSYLINKGIYDVLCTCIISFQINKVKFPSLHNSSKTA